MTLPLITLGNDLDLSQLPPCRFRAVVEFYHQHEMQFMQPWIMVNGLPIHFDPTRRRIGINLSAGTDSTLLMYILCEAITQLALPTEIHPISVVRFWEHHAWSERAKAEVCAWFQQRYPRIVQQQQWGFLPTAYEMTPIGQINLDAREQQDYQDPSCNSDVYYFRSFNNYMVNKLGLEAIYSGTTTNPIDTAMPMSPEFRDARELKFPDSIQGNHRRIRYLDDREFLHIDPFGLIEKNWILAQYDNFGLSDLLLMTRSCVESDDPVRGCGRMQCFHCGERFWAIANKGMFLRKKA